MTNVLSSTATTPGLVCRSLHPVTSTRTDTKVTDGLLHRCVAQVQNENAWYLTDCDRTHCSDWANWVSKSWHLWMMPSGVHRCPKVYSRHPNARGAYGHRLFITSLSWLVDFGETTLCDRLNPLNPLPCYRGCRYIDMTRISAIAWWKHNPVVPL